MNKAILLQSDDWEGLFINDELMEEAHRLEGGLSRVRCFKDLSLKYNFNLDDMVEKYVEEEDEKYLCKYGSFPNNINELLGEY